jgi:aldehyde dehydrogenase (NAD+)
VITTPALIGGEPVENGKTVPIFDPSTGSVIAKTPDCGAAEVDQAVSVAKAAGESWRKVPVAERAKVIRRIGQLLLDDIDEFTRLESLQVGKPLAQSRRDVEITARYFDFYASAVESLFGATIPVNNSTHVFTTWEPHGVTGHIIPWNYPLQILGRSIAPGLAMGNGTVLKPAEEAPLTTLRLVQVAEAAGLPRGLYNVVTGNGETAGSALTHHPGVGHISFTGSVDVGRLVAAAAATHLIPATLELGGKSPNIVFADADLDRALPVIVNTLIQNGGQSCSAATRLLVHESIHDQLVDAVSARFAAIEIGPAMDDPALGPLITGEQRDKVVDYIELGRSTAKVVQGGRALSGGRFGDGYFVEPTIITEVDPQSRIGQEEIFGPVLCVTPFTTTEEAIALANVTDYGLVAGVWTQSLSTAFRMLHEVVAGQVFVNTYGVSGGVELPFGGFKMSGYGREKAFEGLKGFGQLKTNVIAI